MKDFTRLRVWQEAHKLTLQIYVITKKFPSDELYGLTSQLRRSAASFNGFWHLAVSSWLQSKKLKANRQELNAYFKARYQIILAKDLGYISQTEFSNLENQILPISRMLTSFHQKLKASG